MDKELIERLSKEAGFAQVTIDYILGPVGLAKFAALVAEECAKEAIPPGFQLVPILPTMEMMDAAGEELYGYPREKAVEWAKEDKFESWVQTGVEAYRAMLKVAPAPANTPKE